MAKKDYDELAKQIIEDVGGVDNIKECFHCQSRFRLVLKDTSLVNLEPIKKMGFIDALINGQQLQVIAGDEVYDLYDAAIKQLGDKFAGGVVPDEPEEPAKKKITIGSLFFTFFGGIAASVQPCIPVLIATGMIKCVALICAQIGILTAASSTYQVLMFVGDAGFYFLPIYVGFNCANKYGGTPLLGALMGAMLLHPDFLAMIGAGDLITIIGLPIRGVDYNSSVLPAFVSVWVMCKIEKWIAKHSPNNVRVVTQPFGTLLIMIPLELCLLAPIGNYISGLIQAFIELLARVMGPFAPAIVAVMVPFMVATGTHSILGPIAIQSIAATGVDKITMPGAIMHNFTHGALSLGISIKSKNPETKSLAASCSFTAFIAGISEPSLYGFALKNKVAMAALIAGQFCGCLYMGIMSVGVYVMGGGGLTFLNLARFIGEEPSNFMNAIIGMCIAMVVAFVIILIFYKDDPSEDIE